MGRDHLVDYLQEGTDRYPDRFLQFFFDGARVAQSELWTQAGRVASNLSERGIKKGEVVGVLLPTSPELVATMFGVFRSGAIMAPLTIPLVAGQAQTAYERLGHIVADGRISTIVTHRDFAPMLEAAGLGVHALTPQQLLEDVGHPLPQVSIAPTDTVIVQYTSGSTANPKGVVLSHTQLIAGMLTLSNTAQITDKDLFCSWLPLSHDMGLISTLAAVGIGVNQHISSPAVFIKNPARWLRHFANQRATFYVGPNFSYRYLLDAFSEDNLKGLDLSHVRLAFNGAEPVDPILMQQFISRFERAGFSPTAMYPVYGLAEATLAVTFPKPGTPLVIDWVDGEALSNDREVIPTAAGAPRARGVVSVGSAVQDIEVRVVGDRKRPSTHPEAKGTPWQGDVLPDRVVGEIQVRGAPVMSGYFRAEQETSEAFDGDWLKTGDLGYTVDGLLFVTGRIKEMMILRGSNYYPEDVEALVRPIPGLYRQRCVAFVLGTGDHERMAVIAETRLDNGDSLERLAIEIRKRVVSVLGIEPFELYLVRPRAIRRTTSGKFQRFLMKELLTHDSLGEDLLAAFRWINGNLHTSP